MPQDASALRGEPSWVWRAGQDRRLALIAGNAVLAGSRLLDIGCGVGAYTERLARRGAHAFGTEIDWPRAVQARQRGCDVVAAVGEHLPFPDEAIDVALLHEVLEHVADDRATIAEVVRLLVPGGRAIVFVPNRWWPFETHGVYWRNRYRFGNAPLVNYLPDPVRNRLAPHVRTYTTRSLERLLDGLPVRVVVHTQVYPGYDKLIARRPVLGQVARRVTYGLECTPFRRLGLSHMLVVEKLGPTGEVEGDRPAGVATPS